MPRDSSGAYTLPAGNPVISGTVIESDWANDTMADFAVQMNNVLTRDGLLGPVSPVLFVNGSVALPGMAFQESPSTGIYRVAPSTVGLAIAGVARQTWTPTVSTITGNLAVTGTITGSGVVDLPGPIRIAGGSIAAPAYSFTGDTDTGWFSPSAGQMHLSTNGDVGFYVDETKRVIMQGVSVPASPQLVVKAGTDGYGVDMPGNAALGRSTVRWLNQAYAAVHFQIQADQVNTFLTNPGNTGFIIQTSNASRFTITGAGNVTFNTPDSGVHTINGSTQFNSAIVQVSGALGSTGDFVSGANVYALNYYINPGTATAAGTFGIPGGLGSAVVTWGLSTAGVGNIDFTSGGNYLMRLVRAGASAHNFLQISNNGVGIGPNVSASGSDASININFLSKGTGQHAFYSETSPQFIIGGVLGTNRYIVATGAVSANPALSDSGAFGIRFPNCSIEVVGGGRPWSGAITESKSYAYNVALGICNMTATANNRIHEWYKDGGAIYGLWISDNGGAATQWIKATGGQTTGAQRIDLNAVTGVHIACQAVAGTDAGLIINDPGGVGAQIRMNASGFATPSKTIRAVGATWEIVNNGYTSVLFAVNENGALTGLGGRAVAWKTWDQGPVEPIGTSQVSNYFYVLTVNTTIVSAPQGTFVRVINTSGASRTLTASGITVVLSGNTGAITVVTIPARGECTVFWANSTYAQVTGVGCTGA